MKHFKLLVVASALTIACAAPASASYLFGYSPSGTQTLTLNGEIVLQANNTGWFQPSGDHFGDNQNYYVSDVSGGNYRDFFGFDLSGVTGSITSAVLNIGNDPTVGLNGGPVTWYTYDVSGTINTFQDYSGATSIWNDLGTGTTYGAVTVSAPTGNVSLALNTAGLSAIQSAEGGSFFVGGSLLNGVSAVPEPASWALMLTGFGLAGVAMRRRRVSKAQFA